MRLQTCAVAISMILLAGLGTAVSQTVAEYYTARTNSNVRAAPTTNSHRIGLLTKGTRVRVFGAAAGRNWYRVQLVTGQVGFVYAGLLQREESTGEAVEQVALTGGPSPAPEDAFAYIIWPNDGEVIPGGEFVVMFGLHNMGVAPADVEKQFTGHHHLLIDTELPPLDEPIPNNDNYVHFGRGQTEYFITLPKGTHTLQLLLGDKDHIPHTPPVMSERIAVRVP
jgi:uncharacterized protein YgiM (DUF1202 family)